MNPRSVYGFFGLGILLFLGVPIAQATELAPFSYFQALPLEALSQVQLNLTYLGGEQRPFPSVAFAVSHMPDVRLFVPFRRAGFDYGKNELALFRRTIGAEELKALIDSVAALPHVTDGGVDSIGVFSFALLDTSGGSPRAFEAIVNDEEALELLTRMGSALRNNMKAAQLLALMACGFKTLPERAVGEVTGSVEIGYEDFSHDPATGTSRCRVRAFNISHATLAAPLELVVRPKPMKVQLAEADGFTCLVFYPGCPYVLLPVPNALPPGAQVVRWLRFDNPNQMKFSLSARLFSGAGER
jgi:hypothetical protein